MPFERANPVAEGSTIGVGPHEAPPPSFLETLAADWRQVNPMGSAFASARMDLSASEFFRVDPDYDVFDDLAGYEPYADRFEGVYNAVAASAVKADIDRETRDRDTLAASGWVGAALALPVAMADPTILLPGGAMVRAGKVGYSTARSAASVGLAGGAAAGVQEAVLQGTQELRTAGESAIGIGGTMLLSGIVGMAGAKFLSGREWKRLGDNLKAELADDVPNPVEVSETIVARMQAAGADTVARVKLDDLAIAGDRAAQAVARATEALRINPGIETMTSPSVRVREVYAQMVDSPIYTRMNMEGETVGPAVENLVKQYQRGALSRWLRRNRDLYRQARKAGFKGTRTDFNDRVARAGRRGDVDLAGDPYVTESARAAREIIFDPLLKRAIEARVLPEDVKVTTAVSYVHRMWNRQKLIGEEDRFREIARRYFRDEIARIPETQRPDFVSEADLRDYVDEVVTAVFDNLTGRGAGDVPEWIVPVTRGPLKERTFRIADVLVEDFLENDMEMVLRRYTRTMGAEVELASKFGRADLRDQFADIGREYDELAAKATTAKERERLNRLRERDIANLAAFRDLIRGTYRAAEEGSSWSVLTRAALAFNYMRLLGGVTLTSLADTARLIGVHGVGATMREALPSLVSNLKAVRISKADAHDLGAVAEVILQSRLASLADLQDPYRYGTAMDRYMSNATNLFSRATGLAWWNDTVKTMAAVMTQNRMARNSLNWSGAGKRERAYMAMLGIDEGMAGRIADQLRKHGIEERGIWGANVGKWDDDVARRTWAASLSKDVDRTIVTKGVADQPLWTRTNWGRLITQFKSFGLASHQRVLIAGLQEGRGVLASQMVFGTAIGMMIAYVKFIERGDFDRAQHLLENPGLWVADGLDRSGILSIPFDLSNTADKVSAAFGGRNIGITAAASALAGDPSATGSVSRYASRNATGAVLGPSAGLFDDLANITAGLTKGDFNKGQANAAIRMLPGATLPGVRTAIHVGIKPKLQEAVAD